MIMIYQLQNTPFIKHGIIITDFSNNKSLQNHHIIIEEFMNYSQQQYSTRLALLLSQQQYSTQPSQYIQCQNGSTLQKQSSISASKDIALRRPFSIPSDFTPNLDGPFNKTSLENSTNKQNQPKSNNQPLQFTFSKDRKLRTQKKKLQTHNDLQLSHYPPTNITDSINSCTSMTNFFPRNPSPNSSSSSPKSSLYPSPPPKLAPPTLSQPLKISDFQLGQCIGSGKFGDVHICKHKPTNSLFALKKILKHTILQQRMLSQFTHQLKIQYTLNHPNIVKLYAHFDDEYHFFLLMEYAPSGTLMQRIHNSEQYTAQVLEQMLQAVSYTHQKHIIHRDIKPQNIVLFFQHTYKLCDFGLSAYLSPAQDSRTSFCGTLDYIAPQMKDLGLYNYSVDIWGLGVLCYEVLFGKAPFKEEISTWKKRGGRRHSNWNWKITYPSYLSPPALKFMCNLLKQNPNERMSLLTALHSEFILLRKQSPSVLTPAEQRLAGQPW